MAFTVIGFNHKTAPINIRELISKDSTDLADMSQQLQAANLALEFMLVSTCNRFEVITICDDHQKILEWLAQYKNINIETLYNHSYIHLNVAACKHLITVCSGMDSMILGENEIFGQIKTAYNKAIAAKTIKKHIPYLMSAIFNSAKQIRTNTNIAASPISLAYTLIKLIESVFEIPNSKILFIGAGAMITKIIPYCVERNFAQTFIANRSATKASSIAATTNATLVNLSDIHNILPQVDIVITAVSSPLPIIGKGLIESTCAQKKRSPLLIIDLGMPRNVEQEVKQLREVYLYNLDNLNSIIKQGLNHRQNAARSAAKIVDYEATACFNRYETSESLIVIKTFRRDAVLMREICEIKALEALRAGKCPEQVLTETLRDLTNKILHKPTVCLRKAIIAGRDDLVQLTKDFFKL
jgi:glutamyl-tRNA reductase